MMNGLIQMIQKLVGGSNQFASGGLLLMIIGGIAVYLRAIPNKIWDWIIGQTTLLVTVKDDDAVFIWIKEWFLHQPFLKRIRRVDLDTTVQVGAITLVPAPGHHYFWYKRRPIIVEFTRNEKGNGYDKRIESFTFRMPGRSQSTLHGFIKEITDCHAAKAKDEAALFTYDNSYWDRRKNYVPRSLDSIILEEGKVENLIADMKAFRDSRERYVRLGIPYHRGYLFYGPPGTGKTSLASAIAHAFGISIHVLNLRQFNDNTLVTAMHNVSANSIILFEDIDCMGSGQARASSQPRPDKLGASDGEATRSRRDEVSDLLGVTLSGLLNVLDGFNAPENVIYVMTSNDIKSLDPALLRPGRIDYRLYMGPATRGQKLQLYMRFFPDATEFEAGEFVDSNTANTMAEFQGDLLQLERDGAKITLDTQ